MAARWIRRVSGFPLRTSVYPVVKDTMNSYGESGELCPLNHITYDAILIVSFGGPESREDVIPFLENVLRGRNVPRERMLAVAEHYYHFEGKSPSISRLAN